MGIIRLLLALSVVGGHLLIPHFWVGTGGRCAVEVFFMISGFYMCLVLDKTYRHGVRHFYLNRALRLFPIYWVVAGATLCFWLATHASCIEQFKALPIFTKSLLALTNVTLFGQDWIMFMGPTPHGVEFVKNFHDTSPMLWTFLLVPPAWTLGVELTFYLIAPFILRGRAIKYLLVMIGVSFLVKAGLYIAGLRDPWTNRFFPSELGFFLLGAVAYKISDRLDRVTRAIPAHSWIATGIIAAIIIPYRYLHFPAVVFFALLFLLLPKIFAESSHNAVDRFLGELSYPIYIVHAPLIAAIKYYAGDSLSPRMGILVVISALAIAVILKLTVDMPVEHIRSRLRKDESEAAA